MTGEHEHRLIAQARELAFARTIDAFTRPYRNIAAVAEQRTAPLKQLTALLARHSDRLSAPRATAWQVAVYSILRDWIKGQITAVEVGLLIFEGAFLGQLMLPSGETVLERVERENLLPLPAPSAQH